MPRNINYLELKIGNSTVEVTDPEALPFSIDYKLEDESDFQTKKGAEAVQIVIPATLVNSRAANGYNHVGFEDMTEEGAFKSFQPAVVKHNGHELLVGKARLKEASETDRPEDYTFDLYGDNSDWIISLKEATLFDFLKHIKFTFTKSAIIDSWQFDGRNESLPYVFAPVRYGKPMGVLEVNGERLGDYNMLPEYMKPSLSKYWLIYWAFKSIGYRVQSLFFATDYFRRQVMPWTWGNFLFSDGTRLDNLDFLAKSKNDIFIEGDFDNYLDLGVTNTTTLGAFDNNDSYSFNSATKEMTWTYLPQFNYGQLEATFHINIWANAEASGNSDVVVRVRWYKNNQMIEGGDHVLMNLNSSGLQRQFSGGIDDFATIKGVNPGDKVTAKVHLYIFDSGIGSGKIHIKVDGFELDYFRIPLGGTIDFENYSAFKSHKILDLIAGVVDEFNLTIKTDTVTKTVYFEPIHFHQVVGESSMRPGFFNGDFVDWSMKQDISKKSRRILFDDYEREVLFKHKPDTSDGLLKVVQDRYVTTLGAAKYVLPERFKAGKKEHVNRFFSSTMHYVVDQWKFITGTAPQMVVLCPENISNTSKNESQNTFQPKSCYYKGVIPGMGWIFDGVKQTSFPFMFAVNYMSGGEKDPVLSYCDERIGPDNNFKIAQGLFKRFYWNRMAIMRNGEWYNTWFYLNNYDVAGDQHREWKICKNQQWELVAIYNYSPMKEQTTNVLLRRYVPVSWQDVENTFPSEWSVKNNPPKLKYDIKYSPLKCLNSDIPKE